LSQNVILVDSKEYQAIYNMASKTMQTYESMFVNKVILRRYAQLLPAFIGGGLSEDDIETLDEVREESRVDVDNTPPQPEPQPKPQARKLQFYREDKELKELSNKYGGNKKFVSLCAKIGYLQTEDMKLSDLIKSLNDDEYQDFLKKLEEAKNV